MGAHPYQLLLSCALMGISWAILLLFILPYIHLPLLYDVAVTLVSLSFLTLLGTAFTDPGIYPRRKTFSSGDLYRQDMIAAVGDRYCTLCCIVRKPRARHCKFCDNCVDVFDHHCPVSPFFPFIYIFTYFLSVHSVQWIGTCIGVRNYPMYFAFISIATLSLVLAFLCSLWLATYHILYYAHLFSLVNAPLSIDDIVTVLRIVGFLIFGLWSSILLLLVGSLCSLHCYLIYTKQSTGEFLRAQRDAVNQRSEQGHNQSYRHRSYPQSKILLDSSVKPGSEVHVSSALPNYTLSPSSTATRTPLSIPQSSPQPSFVLSQVAAAKGALSRFCGENYAIFTSRQLQKWSEQGESTEGQIHETDDKGGISCSGFSRPCLLPCFFLSNQYRQDRPHSLPSPNPQASSLSPSSPLPSTVDHYEPVNQQWEQLQESNRGRRRSTGRGWKFTQTKNSRPVLQEQQRYLPLSEDAPGGRHLSPSNSGTAEDDDVHGHAEHKSPTYRPQHIVTGGDDSNNSNHVHWTPLPLNDNDIATEGTINTLSISNDTTASSVLNAPPSSSDRSRVPSLSIAVASRYGSYLQSGKEPQRQSIFAPASPITSSTTSATSHNRYQRADNFPRGPAQSPPSTVGTRTPYIVNDDADHANKVRRSTCLTGSVQKPWSQRGATYARGDPLSGMTPSSAMSSPPREDQSRCTSNSESFNGWDGELSPPRWTQPTRLLPMWQYAAMPVTQSIKDTALESGLAAEHEFMTSSFSFPYAAASHIQNATNSSKNILLSGNSESDDVLQQRYLLAVVQETLLLSSSSVRNRNYDQEQNSQSPHHYSQSQYGRRRDDEYQRQQLRVQQLLSDATPTSSSLLSHPQSGRSSPEGKALDI